MAYIDLPEGSFGIRSLAEYRPDLAEPLYQLVDCLLRGKSELSEAERELIAAYVSYRNQCVFCYSSHAAAASVLLKGNQDLVQTVLIDPEQASISPKLKILLRIAGAVQQDARTVSSEMIGEAKTCGATEREIHDTVLIAATFCFFNRYVDGLNTHKAPADDLETYNIMGEKMVNLGYIPPSIVSGN